MDANEVKRYVASFRKKILLYSQLTFIETPLSQEELQRVVDGFMFFRGRIQLDLELQALVTQHVQFYSDHVFTKPCFDDIIGRIDFVSC